MLNDLNKRGASRIWALIFFIFLVFVFMVIIGVIVFTTSTVNQAILNITDFNVTSNISFISAYQDTTQIAFLNIIRTADSRALLFILGLIVVMIMIGYVFRTDQKLWIILDIFVIVIAYIMSIYFVQVFDNYINSITAINTIYANNLSQSSSLFYKLPGYIPIIGVIMMIVTYGMTRRKDNFETVGGLGY